MSMLIIPDIHGRNFWKNAIEKHFDNTSKAVFLGDFLDSYPWEEITRKDAIRNFEEIINLKSEYKDKVILLIGNHDGPYIDKRNFHTRPRYDSSNAYHIEGMFHSHRSLFQLAHEEYINGKRYLFTHAGLIPQWYERYKDLIGELTVPNLNRLLGNPKGMQALCEVTRYRGGYDKYGSIVWLDVHDMTDAIQLSLEVEGKTVNDDLPWEYQVFGHSQQEEHPIITKEFACLDCRKAFILTDEGGFQEV